MNFFLSRHTVNIAFMEKMYENYTHLFKNLGCNSISSWGMITVATSPEIFKLNMLGLAENVLFFERQDKQESTPVVKLGPKSSLSKPSICLSNLRGNLHLSEVSKLMLFIHYNVYIYIEVGKFVYCPLLIS